MSKLRTLIRESAMQNPSTDGPTHRRTASAPSNPHSPLPR